MLGSDSVMRFRYLLCITLLVLCHGQMRAQLLTEGLPGGKSFQAAGPGSTGLDAAETAAQAGPSQYPSSAIIPDQQVPDEPGQQLLPLAKPETMPPTGTPVRWEALQQTRVGDVWTLTGEVVLYYKNFVLHADKVTYHQSTSTVDAEGHLLLEGGENDAIVNASHGEVHLDSHTAVFYDVSGSIGARRMGKTVIYSTPDPFLFTGRMLLQTGQNSYRIIDGAMTSCRLPKPDWELISRTIEVVNGKATTHNSVFELKRVPLFYLPFLQRNLDETGRESGILIPAFENSGVKGIVFGEQVYWVINRSVDLTVGAEYWSKRGFAPNGDFRYRGPGLDSLIVRWNALLDRGVEETIPATGTTPASQVHVNQGGADILATGRKDLTPETRVAGAVEYLSSYIYRLAFDENLAQATSSEVQSDLSLTHTHRGFVPSVSLKRFQSFAGSTSSDGAPVLSVPEVRVLHLPSARFDVVDRPLNGPFKNAPIFKAEPLYWGMGASIGDLDRAEPHFHARNVGRGDLYPHIEWPLHLGEWQIVPELALRITQYSGSQTPDLAGTHFNGVPYVSHDPLSRRDLEASIDIRPPALERDFSLNGWNRVLRHVIEPEIFYHYVYGIHNEPETLRFDTADIATNTNEAGFSLTQRFYLRPITPKTCESVEPCAPQQREWVSWQIAQKFFADPTFGGALIPDRRNVFDSTLDMTGVAFLTSQRNIGPLISRLRFEAVDHLRIEWDMDYDTKAGRLGSDNVYAGYSFGRTTIGIGHALLNAADENGSTASVIQSNQVSPFLYFGKPSDNGLSVALNSSYDFTHGALQYGGVEAIYNKNCCGIEVGYRRFALGSLRDETEWLWGFTLSSIGSAGNIRRSTSVFPTADALSRLY
jgi:LPS-assembly protein